MLPVHPVLRSLCEKLAIDTETATSIARMEREESSDYGAAELIGEDNGCCRILGGGDFIPEALKPENYTEDPNSLLKQQVLGVR